jgi:serine/threonine protein kinase
MTMTDERDGIADYKFIRQLGAGSHGVFYLAYPPKRLPVAAEFVAVKVLSGGSSQDVFRWAHRELAAFAAVSSPYLVTLYDAGQQGEEVYYSMEYLPGGSVAVPAEPFTRPTALRAMAHAARATHALHEAGIAHRDIKPGNVLLYPGGGQAGRPGSQPRAPAGYHHHQDGASRRYRVPRPVPDPRRPSLAGQRCVLPGRHLALRRGPRGPVRAAGR